MIDSSKQLEYIRNQLAWIKSKVELDNQLGLYDINKLGEDVFMYMLNDVYDLNLKRAELIEKDFPAIDLIDDINKIVIQVTSTTTAKKLRTTIEKFKKLTQYSDYQLKIFYIKEKPSFNKDIREEFENSGISSDDILGIDDIINIIQAEPKKCETLYKTIQQRMDAISFKFNLESYFEQVEPHLQHITSDKFQQYEKLFMEFIESNKKVLDIYAVGGSGKSHLLRYLGLMETEYIPLIFTKQINIEEDLKKLDLTKKYLFIIDDIDRFLDQPILLNLLSYTLNSENIKLILSYRTPSKSAVQAIYRRYGRVDNQELEIVWSEDEVTTLITTLIPNLEEKKVLKLAYTFNKNPYLITQAISGDIESIKEFSKKIIDDTKVALKDFNLSEKEIKDLLFNLSLITPISKKHINKDYDEIINRLVDSEILRELASKYRFNPDMIGDLYLANYIDENKNTFEEIVEENLKEFSDTVFTNLSYALVYNDSDSLQDFIKRIIQKWTNHDEYKNEYLALINKVVYYAPMESFVYLQKSTSQLQPKKTNALGQDSIFSDIITNYSPPKGDWSSDSDAINLESIEPIISQLIFALKNNIDCEELKIGQILKYLTSKEVISLPKPYYDNQTLESIFSKLVSPLNTRNFDVIFEALAIMEQWIEDDDMDKFFLLQKSITQLLKATFDDTRWEGVSFTMSHTPLNLDHKAVQLIIDTSKNILFKMLESKDNNILYNAIDSIQSIGGHMLDALSVETQNFYIDIQKEALLKCKDILTRSNDFVIISKIEDTAIRLLRFTTIKNESLEVLGKIKRTWEYLFYQLVRNTDVPIFDYDNFYNECMAQDDIKEWIYQSIISNTKNKRPIDDEWKIIDDIAKNYTSYQEYLNLLNTLDTSNWNSYSIVMQILRKWLSMNNKVLIDMALNHFDEIKNDLVSNVLKEALLLEGKREVTVDDISHDTIEDDVRIYINTLFKNYTDESIDILNKIIDISQSKEPQYIRWIISLVSGDMYFKIREDVSLYKKFEHIIIQFLDWQLEYNFDVESYITYHILHDTIDNDNISNEVIIRLEKIVKNDDITIREHELKSIYNVLGYGLKECIEILYNKLSSLKENGNPKYIFTHYFDSDKVSEVELLKEYIRNNEDFKFLVTKVLEYYEAPIKFMGADGNEHGAFINLDYFFKYTVTKEYLEELFNELHNSSRLDDIKLLYKIVPVNSDYLEIIVKNLNILEDNIDEKELINYLNQVGKIKSWSRSHGENSSLLLDEEALFFEIMNRVDSLSLQLKLKEQLKYIEIQKREELEDDISHLLDK